MMWTLGINRIAAPEPEVPTNEQHSFGGHSDLCTYCGIGRGWFSTHEGKKCNARVALKTSPGAIVEVVAEELTPRGEQLCVHGKRIYMSVTGLRHYAADGGELCPPDPPQPKTKPLQQATGRKFR